MSPKQAEATVGDKVVVRLEVWESRHVNPEGEIIEVLGSASAPGVDMLSIIRKYHLPTEFPRDVLKQADRFPKRSMHSNSRDARTCAKNLPSRSILMTRAISTTRFAREDREWRLAARRPHRRRLALRRTGMALDREARKRGNEHLSARSRDPDVSRALSNESALSIREWTV